MDVRPTSRIAILSVQIIDNIEKFESKIHMEGLKFHSLRTNTPFIY
jgi:hypothetical protein